MLAGGQGRALLSPYRAVEGCPEHSNGEKSPQSTAVPKKKRGFCECCQETFEELQKVKAQPHPGSSQQLWGLHNAVGDGDVPVVGAVPLEGEWVHLALMWSDLPCRHKP